MKAYSDKPPFAAEALFLGKENMSDMEMDPLANRSSSGLDYSTLLEKLLQQNGYTSDNSKHGLKSALKDYEAVFHSGAPKWLDLVWPSIGVSLLHLALSFKQPLPENVDLPQEALKNGLR